MHDICSQSLFMKSPVFLSFAAKDSINFSVAAIYGIVIESLEQSEEKPKGMADNFLVLWE